VALGTQFEALLFMISIAFILLAMAKERAEQRHETAAMIDPLTGISNRRAFLHEGEHHATDERSAPDRGDAARPR
jgi:GGDEF domain-containing protein